ncbi:hypothetical protein PFI31113_03638 [Pandoraea fibrosis]|uniref:Uncharacterized protein n=1 Tax=Pandoraea fibrosis TaxID=1891094 RepID=A0A5E4X5N8_9BURK|nr:hypothetical protein PFI31113_03638 [Pandoraea fibrosis]
MSCDDASPNVQQIACGVCEKRALGCPDAVIDERGGVEPDVAASGDLTHCGVETAVLDAFIGVQVKVGITEGEDAPAEVLDMVCL